MPAPIALSDSQLDMILNAARPLQPDQRGPFLEAVATDGAAACERRSRK